MVKIENISKTFTKNKESIYAVKPLSFEINQGEVISLVGESGSGKTTLSRILSGLLPPDTGKIFIDDVDVYGTKNKREIYKNMQLVMQNSTFALNPPMTIYECIAEPLRNILKLSKEEINVKVNDLLDEIELPKSVLDRRPRQISGGQQKRVCIARAIGVKPKFIIFDEAVIGLDVVVKEQIMDLLVKVQKIENCSYLFISHDLEIALYLANRIFVMKEGEIVERVDYSGDISVFQHEYSKTLLRI